MNCWLHNFKHNIYKYSDIYIRHSLQRDQHTRTAKPKVHRHTHTHEDTKQTHTHGTLSHRPGKQGKRARPRKWHTKMSALCAVRHDRDQIFDWYFYVSAVRESTGIRIARTKLRGLRVRMVVCVCVRFSRARAFAWCRTFSSGLFLSVSLSSRWALVVECRVWVRSVCNNTYAHTYTRDMWMWCPSLSVFGEQKMQSQRFVT